MQRTEGVGRGGLRRDYLEKFALYRVATTGTKKLMEFGKEVTKSLWPDRKFASFMHDSCCVDTFDELLGRAGAQRSMGLATPAGAPRPRS